ncbi:MAG TPA: family 78 glycoside hydrolase catalytic domain [Aggregatilineaceae bacterium]|nr:family 78 glycoside hydrolase catalytic domain [Aggregatilineaceae bacterium]
MVASTTDRLDAGAADLWDSGKTPASHLPLVEYAGRPLASRQRAYWQVRAWDAQDRPSGYSAPAWFELGLLKPDDWKAEWIGFPAGWNGKALYFRDSFQVEKPVQTARAYVSGLGWYELHLNGTKVGQRVLDPAQTDYGKRILYTTYDIQSLLQSGLNVVGAIVGNGWYGTPKLLAQIELQYQDGTLAQVVTGRRGQGGSWWRVSDGPILENSIFDGEVYDARLERPDWDTPEGFKENYPNLDAWAGAMVMEAPGGKLVAQALEPIQVVETRRPIAIQQPKPGVYVLDTGQNLAGWGALTVQGPRGTTVTMRYAESLYEDGTVNQENLRSARARDIYILKGDGVETWEPRFTYHGVRYFQVEGFPGEPTIDSIQIRVARSAVEPTGQFECDHPLLSQLHRAIWWTEASNLYGLPTDCPQRDERMGWLNDMAARSEEAICNFDLARLLSKWLNDIADAQDSAGAIADTAPFRWGSRPADPVSVCYLLIPWLLYCHYGDRRELQDHYDGMKRWVDYLATRAPDHIIEYSYYGDWAPPITESLRNSLGSSAIARDTPGKLVSTAFYAYSTTLFAQIAQVLGREDDAVAFRERAAAIREAFNDHFWDDTQGGYGSNNQACNSLALYMGLVPEQRKTRVLANLVRDVEEHDCHLTTGNLCTKYIMEVLTEAGYADLAFALATQTAYPSWGYMLSHDATTMWERWEQATGRGMNSHNHAMYGSVGAWFYRALAGIQTRADGPGFGRFSIHPYVPAGMKYARASLITIRGLVESAWEVSENAFFLRVYVPVSSQAHVDLPAFGSAESLSVFETGTLIWANGQQRGTVPGLLDIQEGGQTVSLIIGSGAYEFTVTKQ